MKEYTPEQLLRLHEAMRPYMKIGPKPKPMPPRLSPELRFRLERLMREAFEHHDAEIEDQANATP